MAAAIAQLKATRGLGASAGQRLILGGCSAGGRGAMGSLDSVAALLPNVDVRGFIDAAAWVDIEPQIPGLQSLQAQAALQVSFLQAPLPASCTALYSGEELWKCIWPSYRLPQLSTPFFLNAASFDTFQVMYTTNNAPGPATPGGLPLLDSFQTATRALFKLLPAGTSIFSTSCMAHCLADSLELFCYAVKDRTLAQALGGWLATGAQFVTEAACTGWNCTHKCGPGPMATWVPENTPPTPTPLCAAYYASVQQNDNALAASGGSAPPQLGLGPTPAPRGGGKEEEEGTEATSVGGAAAPAAGVGVVSASEPALSAEQRGRLAVLVG